MTADGAGLPQIAVIGAGIFARTQYIPRLREIAHLVVLKAIWSRTEESAKAATELARDFAPEIECKWGDAGLEEIMADSTIMGVAVVLAGQVQVELSLKMLKAGKHVIQGSMNSSNPYFSSSWRRNFVGGFILDMGVHFIAGLRMILWRVDETKGTIQIERGIDSGKHGYQDGDHKAETRSSYVEGARDVAVLEAMLESSEKQGTPVQVKRF
ncbi:hypothetical protein PR202_gb16881 [Eleusine coracana subsp. coracana]|uniref:Gfo/Idh/MocA-like oxidoreductase N-terminal domain-containing protein n=1 Tax=Eleusine coracana subsp. coracana TaxID=191504 RepID=A0AAV5EZ77_ELECO|nr:hypothetical protein PR202_gb16881 [Eleusine coracana subsp. coracana]